MPDTNGVPLPVLTPQDLSLGLTLLSPVLIVVITGILVLLVDLIITDWVSRRPLMWISSLGLLIGIGACGVVWGGGNGRLKTSVGRDCGV